MQGKACAHYFITSKRPMSVMMQAGGKDLRATGIYPGGLGLKALSPSDVVGILGGFCNCLIMMHGGG